MDDVKVIVACAEWVDFFHDWIIIVFKRVYCIIRMWTGRSIGKVWNVYVRTLKAVLYVVVDRDDEWWRCITRTRNTQNQHTYTQAAYRIWNLKSCLYSLQA